MDFARLRQIDALFAVRWEIFALACLADGPLRYRQLTRAVNRHTRARVSDTTVTRLLKKLDAAGLIVQTPTAGRRPTYSLTNRGEAVIRRIGGLIDAMGLLDDFQAAEVEADS